MPNVLLRLLGPMELRVDGESVPLGPARQRTVLAALAVDAGRPVPLETLIARVWDDDPPARVRTVVYSYITRLRRVLRATGDQAALVRRAGGYMLDVDPDSVDLLMFGRLVRAAARGDAEFDLGPVEQAFRMWQGPALADLSGEWVARTRHLVEQQWLDALLAWSRAQLAAGRPGVVIDALREPATQYPLVEPLAALLVDALHRSGRAAEALDRYASVRRHLVDELGTEPGTELRELHQALLRGDEEPPVVVPARRSPATTLPADTGAFTGRAREIEQITAAASGGRVLLINAIAGMPGVGKTALAVHMAHRLCGDFPDGQVFVDLHGHTAGRSPADPGDVLATLLAADGVDPRQLPAGTEARSALWRARLAGRRTLIVLDNAVDSAQVSPLLPASPGCLVLVSSRRFLGDLPGDAIGVSLDVLSAGEAEQMFRRLAPDAAGSPEQVVDLVTACGFLPLAVSLLARLLRRHRSWTVADLLRETRTRLLDVTAEHASVAAAFGLSYQHLPADRQHFFRLLTVHPGTGIEPYAAAALAGLGLGAATEHLDALQADSLLIEVGYRRFTMHDLIRSYAGTLAAHDAPDDRQAATDRLFDFYQRAAGLANARMIRVTRPATAGSEFAVLRAGDGPELPEFADQDEAMSWMRVERGNLRACLAGTNDPYRIVVLTAGCTELLRRDGPWTEALALHAGAARAAAHLGDRLEHANALGDLATVRRLSGDYSAAERDTRRALELYRELGNRLGEANALTGLAKVLSRAADYTTSATVVQQALDLYRDLGDLPGEAGALVELAIATGMTSDFRGAQDLLGRALDLYRRLGDRPGQAYALRLLGTAHGRVGDYLGARDLLKMALELYRQLGGRLGAALTHSDLGRIAAGIGDYPEAARALRAALDQHREIHYRVGESAALLYLGGALRRSGDLAGAAQALREALALDREIGNRSGEAMVLNELGAVHRLSGDVDRAIAAHQEALEVAELVPSPWDKAQSLAGFGRCAMVRGRHGEGAAQLRTALDIFRRINAAEAAEVAAELSDLA
jgi:DNA-binding SARP family transcriptional activator/tetratricopeptide (TPR) repeat protein